ncbi:MAG: XkdX family protein [Erysipelotrichaceae bacterium]|nr:XkdX family protein [Erysipelotrichaceae bacterium]
MNFAEKIKYWYSTKMWNLQKVKDAVKKGKITAEQYKDITGEEYEDE